MGGKEERDKRGGCGVSRGFVIVHRLRLFCGQGEKRVEEEANQRRDGKLVTGGGRGEEEADGKTRRGDRRQESVSDGSTETGRLSGRYKN